MKALLVDFEATGIDASKERATEIGALVTSLDFTQVHDSLSVLMHDSSYPEITPEVEKVTGITQDLLDKEAVHPLAGYSKLGELVTDEVVVAVAFNKSYDETLYKAELSRLASYTPGMHRLNMLPWVCAMVDVESNYQFKSWKLSHLALEYKVPVDPNKLHRAINDCELMRVMLVAAGISATDMLKYAAEPWVIAVAMCKKPWDDGGASTGIAKELGFGWQTAKGDPDKKVYTNRWVKRIKLKQFEQLAAHPTLEIRLL